MRLTLLGTGNAGGMPLYGCECNNCVRARAERSLQRKPCSALLETPGGRFLIDAGLTDLAERFPPGSLAALLLTHFHVDHVQGLFHLRWGRAPALQVNCPNDSHGCADLYKHPGFLAFQPRAQFESFSLCDLRVTCLPLIHSKPTLGYLLEQGGRRIAYLTDTEGLPPRSAELLSARSVDCMVIDCSFPPGGGSGHNDLRQALQLHRRIAPQRTVLTHIGHDLDVWLTRPDNGLLPGVVAGHDGMVIDLAQ